MKRTRAEVLSSRSLGDHHTITIVAPEVAERVVAGQFIHVAMPPGGAALLRRPFSVAKASRQGGWAGTIDFVVGARDERSGSAWLRSVKAHGFLDVIGPLGKGFAPPKNRDACLLVGEGYATGQLYFLAETLRALGKRVDMLLVGEHADGIYKAIEGKRVAQSVTIVTADGSAGHRGTIADVLPDTLTRTGAEVLYAAGSSEMLAVVAAACAERRIPAQVAVEATMACGWGQCFTCTIPVVGKDGTGYDMMRSCSEGPVFNASRIAWDLWEPGSTQSEEAAGTEGAPLSTGFTP